MTIANVSQGSQWFATVTANKRGVKETGVALHTLLFRRVAMLRVPRFSSPRIEHMNAYPRVVVIQRFGKDHHHAN